MPDLGMSTSEKVEPGRSLIRTPALSFGKSPKIDVVVIYEGMRSCSSGVYSVTCALKEPPRRALLRYYLLSW